MLVQGQVALPPTERVILGVPAATAITVETEKQGARRVFLLVSHALNTGTEEIRRIEAALGARHATTWSGMAPHGPRSHVLAAANAARAVDADLIVTVGGGSITDAGKIIPVLLKHDVRTVEGFEPLHIGVTDAGELVTPDVGAPDIRVICVPTTLSGGEFNPLSGATEEVSHYKQGYEHRMMAPVSVILDPALTVHTPEWLWLSTGVRAVDHAVEALASKLSNPYFDGLAASALTLLADGLPRVKADPGDLEGRLNCQIGAWQSMGPIIGGLPMGASHAIGHTLGGTCNIPHGYTSCVMSPYVLAWNAEDDASRQGAISRALGAPGRPASEVLDAFIAGLGMPRTLRAVGITREQLPKIAQYTLKDIWGRTNPRPIQTAEDVMVILERAF